MLRSISISVSFKMLWYVDSTLEHIEANTRSETDVSPSLSPLPPSSIHRDVGKKRERIMSSVSVVAL